MTRFLAAIFVTLVAASAPFAPTAIAQSKAQEAWQRVDGEVELKEADALRSAEDAAARLVWEQLGEHWLDVVGPIVPRERATRELERWLRAEQIPGPALRLLERELFTSSVGTAYRQGVEVALRGAAAEELRRKGDDQARRLRSAFGRRYVVIAALWFILFFAASRLDRASQGYLTKRIRFGTLLLAIGGSLLIWPHGFVLLG
jgi:hypothetical protein